MSKDAEGASFRPVVGIDLGTTNSSVAYIREGAPYVIPSPEGDVLLPSCVLIDTQDRVIIGKHARDGLVAMPDRSVAAIKRSMGSTAPVTVAGKKFLPEEISALILKELRSYLIPIFGEEEVEAVITVPAYFSDAQRRATKRAGELAGFIVERIINEPTAAALAYGLNHSQGHKNILVYDLGGGTFDVSVVTVDQGVLEVRSSNGNRQLGGEDFDWRLVDWMAERVQSQFGVDPRDNLRARALLKDLAEHVKWTLSSENTASVESPVLLMNNGTPITLTTEITRKEFVQLIQPWLNQTMALVSDVLSQANLTPRDIHDILMVGGSTRIPQVQSMISEYFGQAVHSEIDPDLAVALGAAVEAGLKSGALSASGLVVTDIAPFSMGIAVAEPLSTGRWGPGFFSPVISRNTTIPCTRTTTVTTVDNGQTEVDVEVFQGEDRMVANNFALGSFRLTGIPPAMAGEEPIQVTFRYNLNGILEASAQIISTKKTQKIVVHDGLERQSAESFQASQTRLESLWAHGSEVTEQEDALDAFDTMEDEVGGEGDMLVGVVPAGNQSGAANDLHQEAEITLADLAPYLSHRSPKISGKAKLLVKNLEAAAKQDNLAALQDALDEATDLLFEWEASL